MEPFHYYGTSEFSALILEGLLAQKIKPSLVISTVPKPQGRKQELILTPVSVLAKSNGLEVLEVTNLKSPEIELKIKNKELKIAILTSFGKIVPQNILDIYPKGIINVHPSLLPLYRGPSPIQSAIRDGCIETGVSIMLLDVEVDHGPILAQKKYTIASNDTTTTLTKKLANITTNILLNTLNSYLNGTLSPTPQNHTAATFTKMITRADGQAVFSKSANELYNQWRAFTPWPGLWTLWLGKRLKLAEIITSDEQISSGLVILKNGVLLIGCSSGSLEIKRLQLDSGKELPIEEFLRGHKEFINVKLPS